MSKSFFYLVTLISKEVIGCVRVSCLREIGSDGECEGVGDCICDDSDE